MVWTTTLMTHEDKLWLTPPVAVLWLWSFLYIYPVFPIDLKVINSTVMKSFIIIRTYFLHHMFISTVACSWQIILMDIETSNFSPPRVFKLK